MGDLLLFGATATFSCNLIFVFFFSKRLSPFIITTYSFMVSAIIFDPFILAGMTIDWNQSLSIWAFAIVSVIIGQGVTTILWNQAMNDVGAVRAAIILNLQPLMTMLLDYWIYQNVVTVQQIVGAAFVFSGILLSSIRKKSLSNKQMNVPTKTISKM